ncbi:MAG: YfhO family protein [Endomicrobiia bacterium]
MKNKIFLLLIFILSLIFFSDIIFKDKTFFQRDIILQFKPWKVYIKNCLGKIDSKDYLDFLPLWNPYNHCGTPFISNIQSQIFYPLSIIFYLFNSFEVAFKIFIIFHIILAGFFMFLFLKNRNLNFISCIAGSIVWCFNGYIISRIEFLSVFSSIIWLPLIIFLIDKFPYTFSLSHVIYLSFAMAFKFLAGHTQIWFYAMCFCVMYVIFLSIIRQNKTIVFMFALSVGLSLVFCCIQFLPTLEFVLHSTRGGFEIKKFGMDFKESATYSLKFSHLINFIYPFYWQVNPEVFNIKNSIKILNLPNYWIYTFYVGVITIFLSVFYFFSRRDIKEKIFLLFSFIFFITYALGENFWLYGFLYEIFPVVRIFRYPATASYIPVFVFCILCSFGLDILVSFIKNEKIKKILYLLPALIFLELVYYSKKITITLPSKILYEKASTIDFLLKLKDINLYRIALTPKTQVLARSVSSKNLYEAIKTYRDNLLGNINLDYFIYNFRGQDIELKNFFDFIDLVYKRKSLDEALPFFSISNVKYILSSEYQSTKFCNLISNRSNMKIYENPFALKKVYFVNKYILETDLEKSKEIMQNIAKNLNEIVIIHTKEQFKINSLNKKAKYYIKNINSENNKIFIEIDNPTDGFLVFSQNFYPGWKCYLNGCLEKIYQCNIYMMCVYLKKGVNQVMFKFEPVSFKIGTVVSLVSLLFSFLFLFEKGGLTKNERM